MGFWKQTSSVDFCEENYIHNYYIAEPHNVWSSMAISLFAFLGYWYGNPTNEKRFNFIYISLFITGLGSMALHTTLHATWQASDELPMLFVTLSILYVIVEMKSSIGSYSIKGLNYMFLTLASLNSYIYFKFQAIYGVFLASYISSVVLIIFWSYKQLSDQDLKNQQSTQLWNASFFMYVAVGSLIWIFDMNCCDLLLPYYRRLGGATLHIVWHIAAGLGTYLLAQSLASCRATFLKIKTEIDWIYGLLPVVRRSKEKDLPMFDLTQSCNTT